MPKIIIQAEPEDDAVGHVTLTERLVAASLESPHYGSQLLERVAWATADAEALESRGPSGASAGPPRRDPRHLQTIGA